MDIAQQPKATEEVSNPKSRLRISSAWRPAAILGCLLVGLFLNIAARPLSMNHDVAALLQMSKMWLEGATAYVDFNTIQPPLILYLGMIPAFLAGVLEAHVIPVFSTVVALVTLWSTLSIWYLVRRGRPGSGWIECALVPALYLGLTFIYRLPEVGGEFGQREHLFVLLYMPFFFLRHGRWEGQGENRWLAVTMGVAAALGASIKPFFVFTALICEAYWFLSKRRVREFLAPEFVAFAGVGCVYALHFLLLPEAVFDALFRRWIPFVMSHYGAYDQTYLILLFLPNFLLSSLVGLLLAFTCPARATISARILRPLMVFTASSIFVYLYQHKLWEYQLIPAVFGALLILAISLDEFRRFPNAAEDSWFEQRRWVFTQTMTILLLLAALFLNRGAEISTQGRAVLALIIVVLALYPTFAHIRNTQLRPGHWLRGTNRILSTSLYTVLAISILAASRVPSQSGPSHTGVAGLIEQETREGDAIAFMATRTNASHPILLQLNRKPGSRYFDFLPLAMMYTDLSVDATGDFPYRRGDAVVEEEALFLEELFSDLSASQPILILIDSGCQGCRRGFVLKDYVFGAGRLDEIFAHYDPIGVVEDYTVLKRRRLRVSEQLDDVSR